MKMTDSEKLPPVEDFVPVEIRLTLSYSAGQTASRFFATLRDDCQIMGTKCPQCGRVLVPARQFCSNCFVATADWVEVGPGGNLVSYTAVHHHQPHHPKEVPFAYGIMRLDGADTNFVHLLGECEIDKVHDGMRLEAVFAENRQGGILDIAYFRPTKEERY